jgi:hypothetical protein
MGDSMILKEIRNPWSRPKRMACHGQVAQLIAASVSLMLLACTAAAATLPTGFSETSQSPRAAARHSLINGSETCRTSAARTLRVK